MIHCSTVSAGTLLLASIDRLFGRFVLQNEFLTVRTFYVTMVELMLSLTDLLPFMDFLGLFALKIQCVVLSSPVCLAAQAISKMSSPAKTTRPPVRRDVGRGSSKIYQPAPMDRTILTC